VDVFSIYQSFFKAFIMKLSEALLTLAVTAPSAQSVVLANIKPEIIKGFNSLAQFDNAIGRAICSAGIIAGSSGLDTARAVGRIGRVLIAASSKVTTLEAAIDQACLTLTPKKRAKKTKPDTVVTVPYTTLVQGIGQITDVGVLLSLSDVLNARIEALKATPVKTAPVKTAPVKTAPVKTAPVLV
jgi:hypothetical protein